jgi:hypothetical protein
MVQANRTQGLAHMLHRHSLPHDRLRLRQVRRRRLFRNALARAVTAPDGPFRERTTLSRRVYRRLPRHRLRSIVEESFV